MQVDSETVTAQQKSALSSKFLSGALSLALASCLGSFQVMRFNDALPYQEAENINTEKIRLVYFNAADFRGNTTNLFKFISTETSQDRTKCFGEFCKRVGADIVAVSEVDWYSLKTGNLDQPEAIIQAMGSPYNYLVVDQYLKSPLWTTGNMAISLFPLKTVHRQLFGDHDDLDTRLGHYFKDFIHLRAKVGLSSQEELDLLITHLDEDENSVSFRRKEQAREMTAYIRELKQSNPSAYIIVAGDFNDSYNSKVMKMFLKDGLLHLPEENYDLPTFQADNPSLDLDHILASSNVKITHYQSFEVKDKEGELLSDHLGVMCDLELLKNQELTPSSK